MTVNVCNHNTEKMETDESGVQGHTWGDSKLRLIWSSWEPASMQNKNGLDLCCLTFSIKKKAYH